MTQDKKHKTDFPLMISVFLLSSIGIVMVYSASSAFATYKFNDSNFFLYRHIVRVLIGLTLMGLATVIDYRKYQKWSKLGLIISIILLSMIFLTNAIATKGASRWLNIYGFSFQPSEFAKFVVIFYMADTLSRRQKNIKSFVDGYLPMLIALIVVSILILLEPDLSSTLILISISFMLFFIGNVKIIHLAATCMASIPFLVGAIWLAPYRLRRITSFLDPDADPLGTGYHIKQSLISLGSGGFMGVGIGMSKEKLLYLPEPFTDSIFAIIGEEMGFLGAMIVLFLFFVILWRGYQISNIAVDLYGRLLAMGITLTIVFSAFINIGVASGVLPITGLTLPFISYGGTSMLLSFASVGVLLNIGKISIVEKNNKTKGRR